MQLVNAHCACTPKWDIRCIHWKLLDVSNYSFRFGFVFAATHHTQVIANNECINLFEINSQASAVVYVDFNLFLRTKYFKYVGASCVWGGKPIVDKPTSIDMYSRHSHSSIDSPRRLWNIVYK